MRHLRVSKWRALSAAVGLVAFGAGAPALAVNLLVNAGFEAPPDPNGVNSTVAGWTLLNDCQRANFANHTPSGIFMIWAKTFQPAGGGALQTVDITGGTNYDFKSYLFFESGYSTITDPVNAQLGLIWLDSGNNPVGTPNFMNIAPGDVQPAWVGAWTQFTLSALAPVAAAKVNVFVGWDGGGPGTGAQSVFFDDASLDGIGTPPTNSTWITNGGGDWNQSANWANGTVPNAVGAVAEFFGAITAPRTVYSDTAITAGALNFNNANTYVIAGAGSLTMQVGTGSAQFQVQQGTHKVNLPLIIASNTTLNVSAGATLKVSDPVTVNAGMTLTQSGAGTVLYESTIDVLSGAGIQLGNASHLSRLSLASGGTATLTLGGNSALKSDSLVLDATAKLDMGNNDLVTGTNKATIQAAIKNARNGGAWDLPGITSSAADTNVNNNTTLGVLSGAEYTGVGGTGTFSGQAYSAGDTLVKYTYYGDTDFNGVVGFDDYTRIDQGFNLGRTGWLNGDFDFSGVVGFDDYSLIDLAFNTQSGTLARAISYLSGADTSSNGMDAPSLQMIEEHLNEFGPGYAQSFLSVVPEPTSMGAIGIGLIGLMSRRRQRHA